MTAEIEVHTGALGPELDQVLRCATYATSIDAAPPFSDQTLLQITSDRAVDVSGVHLVAREDQQLVGYGFAANGEVEFVVHPEHRRLGHGGALLRTALDHARRRAGTLRFWAHGEHPGAVRLAAKFGLGRDRILYRMERSLRSDDLKASVTAAGSAESIRLRSFQPGHDEAAWLSLNRRAFAGHSEQADWTLSDVKLREAQPWFDAAGFMLAERVSDGALLGAHWTKIHTPTDSAEAVGEVYVLSVDPEAAGGGLGRVLLAAGLSYLRQRGLRRVMLYTDATNTAAMRLYTKLGFTQVGTDVQYLTQARR